MRDSTIAVAIAFPVLILVSNELPRRSSKLPWLFATNNFTNELFNISINLTKIGAIPIAAAPKEQSH